MNPNDRLSKERELERYLKHQNNYDDTGYRDFLLQIAEPCFKLVKTDSRILDYGSGNNKVMERIFKDKGFDIESYDPYFYPIPLDSSYDLVVCNEVCEHFYNPSLEFRKIVSILKPNGFLVIGTNLRQKDMDLKSWHYLSDETHVSIYNERTLHHIADTYGFTLFSIVDQRIAILKFKSLSI